MFLRAEFLKTEAVEQRPTFEQRWIALFREQNPVEGSATRFLWEFHLGNLTSSAHKATAQNSHFWARKRILCPVITGVHQPTCHHSPDQQQTRNNKNTLQIRAGPATRPSCWPREPVSGPSSKCFRSFITCEHFSGARWVEVRNSSNPGSWVPNSNRSYHKILLVEQQASVRVQPQMKF